MLDVQNREDERGIAIQRVGVKEVRLPFLIKKQAGGYQQVLARIAFTVSLPMEFKGTHMSRFLEILLPWSEKPLAEEEMDAMLTEALDCLHAEAAEVSLAFTYFLEKKAPVSGRASLLDVDASFTGRKRRGEPMQFELGLSMPFTSLCPCSKERTISVPQHACGSAITRACRASTSRNWQNCSSGRALRPSIRCSSVWMRNTSPRQRTRIRNLSRTFCAIAYLPCVHCRGLHISHWNAKMRSPSTATMPLRHMKSI